MIVWRCLLTVPVAAMVIAAPASARRAGDRDVPRLTIDAAALDRDFVTVGGGIGYVPSYEGSDDYVVVPLAGVRGRIGGFDFASRGLGLSVDLIRDPSGSPIDFDLGPVLSLNLNRTGHVVDPQVRALGHIGAAVQLGGYAALSRRGVMMRGYDSVGIRVAYVRDVSGVTDSFVVTPSISYGTPLSRRSYVSLSGSATIVGDGYARTYFGVDAAGSARSGLPVFDRPRGGVKNYTGTMLANYALTGDLLHGLGLFALGSYSQLQGDFARSPVTSVAGRADQWYGAMGIGYTF